MSKIFTNLHMHSVFSLGDAISSTDDIARTAKNLGMTACSITDHGTLSGWLQFKDSCRKYGIKPIFGVEAYFVDDVNTIHAINDKINSLKEEMKPFQKSKFKKDKKELEKYQKQLVELEEERNQLRKYNHLILLAKNAQGRDNIIRIHNDAILDGIYYKPRIDWSVLEKHKGGIIATTACLGGRISKLLEKNNIEGAKKAVARFKKIFGEDNFFLELQLNEIELQKEINEKLIKLSEATNTQLVVTCDSHFFEEGQEKTRALIRQLDKEPDEIVNDDALVDLYIKNEDMLLEAWRKYMSEYPAEILARAINNTRQIANMVEDFPFDTSLKFPHFQTPDNLSQEDYLKQKALEGLVNKGLQNNPKYLERLKMEFETITILGFASYFNVVADLINFAKKSQPVGPARGSAGGSLLAYLIGISEVDPIKFELFFERFLESSRGVIAPTFGLELNGINLDFEKINMHTDGNCVCHKHH